MTNIFNQNDSNALFSECGKHRIFLYRIWDETKPCVMFIGLNPSTANSVSDDPTIRKVKKIAAHNGFGGVYMMNLFTYISTDPKALNIREGNIVAADNWLFSIAKKCEKIVFAWGNFDVIGRDKEVKALFPRRYALHVNKNGSPKHPLYCKDETILIRYNA